MFDAQFGLINALLKLVGLTAQTWLADPQLAFIAIVIADVWQWTPFVFIMMIAALAGVDGSVIEAARIDGAKARAMPNTISALTHTAANSSVVNRLLHTRGLLKAETMLSQPTQRALAQGVPMDQS